MLTIKETIFSGWNFMRFLRLGVGIFFIIQAIQIHDTLMGVVGGFFLITALANAGCCGNRCAVPINKSDPSIKKEISYEEIQQKVD